MVTPLTIGYKNILDKLVSSFMIGQGSFEYVDYVYDDYGNISTDSEGKGEYQAYTVEGYMREIVPLQWKPNSAEHSKLNFGNKLCGLGVTLLGGTTHPMINDNVAKPVTPSADYSSENARGVVKQDVTLLLTAYLDPSAGISNQYPMLGWGVQVGMLTIISHINYVLNGFKPSAHWNTLSLTSVQRDVVLEQSQQRNNMVAFALTFKTQVLINTRPIYDVSTLDVNFSVWTLPNKVSELDRVLGFDVANGYIGQQIDEYKVK